MGNGSRNVWGGLGIILDRAELKEEIANTNPDALFADGFDQAILGVTTQCVVVYSANRCISILEERDGMTEEEAVEFFDFNVAGAYVGENTPVFVWL